MGSRHWFTATMLTVFCLGWTVSAQAGIIKDLFDGEDYYDGDQSHMVQFGLENGMNLSWGHKAFSDTWLRYGVDVFVDGNETEYTSISPDTTLSLGDNSSSFRSDLHVDLIVPFEPYKNVRLYVGGGPFVGWDRYDQEREYLSPTSDLPNYVRTSEGETWIAGLRALVGGEYAFSGHFSMFVETDLSGYVGWGNNDNVTPRAVYDDDSDSWQYEKSRDKSEYTTWRADMSNVMIGITFRY